MIYVIGGNGATLRLDTVGKYEPATNSWSEEAPLLVGKSEPSAGLLGATIVAADGYSNASCYGVLAGQLYVASGGDNGSPQTITESFKDTTGKWTTQASIPQAVIAAGSAIANGLLYCFGGSSSGIALEGTVYNNVLVYQP